MNPVIFFDELDKVSDTPRGEEIIGVLTHLTDHSQNRTFTDRYFEGIPLDLSRALFVFSFNDESRLNHVLKDRLTVIHTEGFDQAAKLKIAREYLMPELLANVGMDKGDVDIGREELAYLCQRCGVSMDEGGVRGIKQALESVILHLNEIRMTQDFDDEGKADDGEKKADAGDKMKADAESKIDVVYEPNYTTPKKADSGNREEEVKKESEDGEQSEQQPAAPTSDSKAKRQKRPYEQQEHVNGDALLSAVGESPSCAGCDSDGSTGACATCQRGDVFHKRVAREAKRKTTKKLRVQLPVMLTKDLIEQLVSQKKQTGAPAMMYI